MVGDGEPIATLADPDLWLLGERGFDALGRHAHFFWEIVRTEVEQLPSPNLLPPGTPGYVNPHVGRRYLVIGETHDRIDLRVRLRPMGIEVLDSLVESGDLDPAVRDAMPTFRQLFIGEDRVAGEGELADIDPFTGGQWRFGRDRFDGTTRQGGRRFSIIRDRQTPCVGPLIPKVRLLGHGR